MKYWRIIEGGIRNNLAAQTLASLQKNAGNSIEKIYNLMHIIYVGQMGFWGFGV